MLLVVHKTKEVKNVKNNEKNLKRNSGEGYKESIYLNILKEFLKKK